MKATLLGQTNHPIAMNDKLWNITATSATHYDTAAYLGNGVVGFRSEPTGLSASNLVINGLYDRSLSGGHVRLIDSYNPMKVKIFINDGKEITLGEDMVDWKQTMDLKNAILHTSYDYASQLRVHTQMLALRNLPMATLAIYEFEALEDVKMTVENVMAIPNYTDMPGNYKSALDFEMFGLNHSGKDKIAILSTVFPTESATDRVAGATTFYFDGLQPELAYAKSSDRQQQLSFSITLKKGAKTSFAIINSFTHTGLTADPVGDSIRLCSREYNLGYRHRREAHKAAWAKLWESDIEIVGDDEAQIDTRLALYSLYSSITTGFGYSIPPCGLGVTAWGGMIFWDADLWMFPPLLAMQPNLAASMVEFRVNTLPQARKRAGQFGYQGAMFPWQSDLHGNEGTPVSYKMDMNEHHITADVALAAWNYFRVTKNKRWLREKGGPLIMDIADFWVSRATKDADGSYHINNVIGPDEYLEDIDDSAFTNGMVKVVLDAASQSARLLDEPVNPAWTEIHDQIVILQHPNGHTLQCAGYDGRKIKQADVNLLAFPVGLITDGAQIAKDLEYYEPRIDPNGPSMSYSVLAASYARLGQKEKAWQLFQKAYQPNRKAPFGFISEKPQSLDNAVFCTGYGGMLQAVIFGFGGMKIDKNGLTQGTPNLPSHWKKLTIKISGQKDIVCLPTSP